MSNLIVLSSDEESDAEIQFVSSSSSKNDTNFQSTSSSPETHSELIEIQDDPQPVRNCYPHYDKISNHSKLLAKCPCCYMKYLQGELEEHVKICYEKTFSQYKNKGEFKIKVTKGGKEIIVGKADKTVSVSKETLPSKERRVIRPF